MKARTKAWILRHALLLLLGSYSAGHRGGRGALCLTTAQSHASAPPLQVWDPSRLRLRLRGGADDAQPNSWCNDTGTASWPDGGAADTWEEAEEGPQLPDDLAARARGKSTKGAKHAEQRAEKADIRHHKRKCD